MATGDQVSGLQALALNAVLDIKPTGTEEWTIHNVYYSASVQFIYTNGTDAITFDSDGAAGARLGSVFHVNITRWLQIKAVTAGNFGYDGIKSHV